MGAAWPQRDPAACGSDSPVDPPQWEWLAWKWGDSLCADPRVWYVRVTQHLGPWAQALPAAGEGSPCTFLPSALYCPCTRAFCAPPLSAFGPLPAAHLTLPSQMDVAVQSVTHTRSCRKNSAESRSSGCKHALSLPRVCFGGRGNHSPQSNAGLCLPLQLLHCRSCRFLIFISSICKC